MSKDAQANCQHGGYAYRKEPRFDQRLTGITEQVVSECTSVPHLGRHSCEVSLEGDRHMQLRSRYEGDSTDDDDHQIGEKDLPGQASGQSAPDPHGGSPSNR